MELALMQFQPGLKQSMQQRIRENLVPCAKRAADNLSAVLTRKYRRMVSPDFIAISILDQGLLSRVEFRLPPGIQGNAPLAHYGDSLLSTYVARLGLLSGLNSNDLNTIRKGLTCRKSLSAFYDFLAKDIEYIGPVTWEYVLNSSEPTLNQKAEFIEGILGLLGLANWPTLARRMCFDIVQHGLLHDQSIPRCLVEETEILPYLEPVFDLSYTEDPID